MKKIFVLTLFLHYGSAFALENTKPPSGEQLFDILFKNLNISLNMEPLCDMKSTTRENMDITLGQHLSTILSESYDTDNIVSLKSACSLSKYDNKGAITNIWDCKLEMKETDKKGEFISSSMVAFYISLDKSRLINGSLRCF